MIRIAFGSVPKDGGTFTFYKNLRPELLQLGYDLRCVTLGKQEMSLVHESYADEGCVFLATDTHNVREQAEAFSRWCESEGVSIVIALNSVAILSSLPHLPKSIRVVSRCANAFDEGYRVTMSCVERIMAIVALTPRLRDDLISDYGADPSLIRLIPNGISPEPFDRCAELHSSENRSESNASPCLNLAFVGRLEHKQKGVLYLPDIVDQLVVNGVSFKLRIAGKGRHEDQLKKRLKPYIESGVVEFVGSLTREEVVPLLCSSDIFLFTSHFEGCPNALLEAMMAGCVPVVYAIAGITDFILRHGETGFIAPMADSVCFAGYIADLAINRDKLAACSFAVAKDARLRFVPKIAAQGYAKVFEEVMTMPLPEFTPLPWSEFRIDTQYQWRWTQLIPLWLKERLKRSRLWISRC